MPRTHYPGAQRSATQPLVPVLILLCAITAEAAPRQAAAASLQDVVRSVDEAKYAPGLFGSQESRSDSLDGMTQWNRVRKVAGDGPAGLEACLENAVACATDRLQRWREVMLAAKGLPPRERLRVVNSYFNRWPYRTDGEVYGVVEYWATPGEFMSNSGDCEDFAIAKFFVLRKLGFSNDQLRIVGLQDRIRNRTHAVLTVNLDDRVLVLDSLSDLILPQERYKHYVARFSVNETTRWSHTGSYKPHEASVFDSPGS